MFCFVCKSYGYIILHIFLDINCKAVTINYFIIYPALYERKIQIINRIDDNDENHKQLCRIDVSP